MIERESTVLPEPDSPTMPSAWPRSSVNDTPSTARTLPRGVLNEVLQVGDLEQHARLGPAAGLRAPRRLDRSHHGLPDVEPAGDAVADQVERPAP